jgi:glycosyltransferase involved in cell wall biosynthesis
MSNAIPQVSILVPTYNRSQLVQQAIASMLAQTFQDFEIIVADNCSTDDTEQAIARLGDSRIIYVKNIENIGPVNNHNRALRLARGKYICTFSDDDIMAPDNLALKVGVMEKYPNVGLVHSNINVIDGDGTITATSHWGYRNPRMAVLWQEVVSSPLMDKKRAFHYLYHNWNFMSMPSVLVRSTFVFRNGIEFNNQLGFIYDWDLWLRVAMFGDFYYLDEKLVDYRIHANNDAKKLNSRLYFRELLVSKLGLINRYDRTDLHKKDYLGEVIRLIKKQMVYAGENETLIAEKIREVKTYLKNNVSQENLAKLKKLKR